MQGFVLTPPWVSVACPTGPGAKLQEKEERDASGDPGFRAVAHVTTMIAGFLRERLFVWFAPATSLLLALRGIDPFCPPCYRIGY